MAIQLGDAVISIKGDATKLNTTFKNVTKKAGIAFTAVGAAITGALGLAINSAVNFRGELAKVNTLGIQDLAALGEGIKAVTAAIGVDLAEATRQTYQIISAGVSEDNAIDFLLKAAIAAKAGMGELADAVNLGTSIMNAFGLESKDVGKIFDVTQIAIKSGKTTIAELGISVGRVAPIFAGLGLTMEEMLAAVTALTIGGIRTKEAISGMKQTFQSLLTPSTAAIELTEKLGLNFSASGLKAEGFAGQLALVSEKTGGNADQLKILFPSMESFNVIMSLAGNQADIFKDVLIAMNTPLGVSAEAFARLREDNPAQAFSELKGQLEVLSVEIGDVFLPVLRGILSIISPIVKGITAWAQKHPVLSKGIVAVTGALGLLMLIIGPLLLILPGLIIALPAIGAAFVVVGTAIAAIGAPILALIAGITLVVAAFTAWIISVGGFKAAWEQFTTFLGEVWDGFMLGFNASFELFKGIWDSFLEFLGGIWESISGVFESGMELVKELWGNFVEFFMLQEVWTAVVELLSAVWDLIKEVFRTGMNFIADMWSSFVEFFMLQEAWNAVTGFLTEMWEGIKGVFQESMGFILGLWDGFVSTIQGAWDAVINIVSQGVEALRPAFEAFSGFLTGIAEGIGIAWEFMGNIIQRVADFIQGIIGGVIDVLGSVTGFIRGLLGSSEGPKGFAGGGVVQSSLQMVGEQGPELAALPRGTRIVSARDTQEMLNNASSQGGGGGGGGTVIQSLTLLPNAVIRENVDMDRLMNEAADKLKVAIENRGGDAAGEF